MDPVTFYALVIVTNTGLALIKKRTQAQGAERLNQVSQTQQHQADEIYNRLSEHVKHFRVLRNFSEQLAMVQPLKMLHAGVETCIDETLPLYRRLLSKSADEPISTDIPRNFTDVYNRLKLLFLLDPDLPALLGYDADKKSISLADDLFDFTPPMHTPVDGGQLELTATEVEHVINYSLRVTAQRKLRRSVEAMLTDLCQKHKKYHNALQARNKLVTDLHALEKIDEPIEACTAKLNNNYLKLKKTENAVDKALATVSGFRQFLVPKRVSVVTVKPNAPLPLRVAKGVGEFTIGFVFIATSPIWAPVVYGLGDSFFKSGELNDYLDNLDKIILKKPPFEKNHPTSRTLQAALEQDRRIAMAVMLNFYNLIILRKILERRMALADAEIQKIADHIEIDKQTRNELTWRFRSCYDTFRPDTTTYTDAIKRLVNKKIPTQAQLIALDRFRLTPIDRTVGTIISKIDAQRYKLSADLLISEVREMKKFLEKTVGYGTDRTIQEFITLAEKTLKQTDQGKQPISEALKRQIEKFNQQVGT